MKTHPDAPDQDRHYQRLGERRRTRIRRTRCQQLPAQFAAAPVADRRLQLSVRHVDEQPVQPGANQRRWKTMAIKQTFTGRERHHNFTRQTRESKVAHRPVPARRIRKQVTLTDRYGAPRRRGGTSWNGDGHHARSACWHMMGTSSTPSIPRSATDLRVDRPLRRLRRPEHTPSNRQQRVTQTSWQPADAHAIGARPAAELGDQSGSARTRPSVNGEDERRRVRTSPSASVTSITRSRTTNLQFAATRLDSVGATTPFSTRTGPVTIYTYLASQVG